MIKRLILPAPLVLALGVFISAQGPQPTNEAQGRRVALGDWPEPRGPHRNGTSEEKGLLEKWALNGQNFLWRAPYGGPPPPLATGNRVYRPNPSRPGAAMPERVVVLAAGTRQRTWE